MQNPLMSVGDVALHFHIHEWKVRRLYERGLLPEPPRLSGSRAISASDLPVIERALRQANYLPVAGDGLRDRGRLAACQERAS